MQSQEIQNGYVVKIKRGEKIMATLKSFLEETEVAGGSLQAIGAVQSASLAIYNPETKDHDHREVNEQREIISLLGTISQVEKDGRVEPHIHAHITLADADYNASGGHLVESTVEPTCEVFIETANTAIDRSYDEVTNLDLLELE